MTTVAIVPDHINRRRLLVALIALPPFDALLGYLSFPIVWWLGNHGAAQITSPARPAIAFAIVAGVAGLLVTITAVLPVSFWLIRRGQVAARHFAIAGAALGNLPFAVYLCFVLAVTIVHFVDGTLADHLSPFGALIAAALRVIALGSLIGAASGVLYWLIAVQTQRSAAGD